MRDGSGMSEYRYVDSFECNYPDYHEWQDSYQPPDAFGNTHRRWYQNLNRRQQFNLIKYYVDDFTVDEPRMIEDLPDLTPTKGQTFEITIDWKQYFVP